MGTIESAPTHVLIADGDPLVCRALNAGACRFLLKDASRGKLIEAIRLTASGRCEVEPGEIGVGDAAGC